MMGMKELIEDAQAYICAHAPDTYWASDNQTVNELLAECHQYISELGRTCHVENTYEYAPDRYEHLLSCGHAVEWADPEPPAYCPECGAEVGAWQEVCADGGMVSETYTDGGESGSICPIPRTSVIFEGQKLTFDDEDSAKFAELVREHFRKLAGLRGDAE